MSNNIQVGIRIRPSKYENIDKKIIEIEDEKNIKFLSNPNKNFTYDHIYNENVQQQEIFKEIGQNMIENMLKGYNCTIFAYGQTGTGKTYTMLGDVYGEDTKGLQIRCLEYLFWRINQMKEEDLIINFITKVQFIEIYNEKIIDLLSLDNNNLNIREDINRGVYIDGSIEEIINNYEEAKDIWIKGTQMRHIGETKMNKESSRSHSIFIVELQYESKGNNGLKIIKNSKFNFVDLAGSERQKLTHTFGKRFKEGCNINKSLTVLGGVINNLVENCTSNKKHHIRYRDSKLTFLLKDSLGGNSKTFMIANIAPENECFSETLSTLWFAQRAKMIKNKAKINEDNKGKVEEYKKEINRLKQEVLEYKNKLELYESGLMNNNNIEVDDSFVLNNKNKDNSMFLEPFGKNLNDNEKKNEINLFSNIKLDKEEKFINDDEINLNLNSEEYIKSVTELERGLNQTLKILMKTQNLLENEIKKKEKLLDDIFHKKPPKLENWCSKDIVGCLKNNKSVLNQLLKSLENSVKLRKNIQKNYSEDLLNLLKTNEKESRISLLNQKINHNNEMIRLREEIYSLKNRTIQLENELDVSSNIVNTLKSKMQKIINLSRDKINKLKQNENTNENKNENITIENYNENLFNNNNNEINNLKIELEKIKIENLNFKEENNNLFNEANQLNIYNDKFKEEGKIYKNEILKLNENINYLENTKLKLIQWNENNIKEKNILNQKIKNYQLNDFNNNKDSHEELINLKNNIENLNSDKEILEQEKNILEETVNYKNNEISNLNNNLRNLENIIKINDRKIMEKDSKIKYYKEEINNINLLKKSDFVNQIKNLDQLILNQKQEIDEKNKNLELLENENELFDIKLNKLKKKYNLEKNNKINLEKQIEKINKDLNIRIYNNKQLNKDNKELKDENLNLDKQNIELNNTITSLNNDIENKNKIINYLKKELEDEKFNIVNHQEKNKLLMEKNDKKYKEIDILNTNLNKLKNENNVLNENYTNLDKQNKILNNKMNIIEKEKIKLERQSNNFFNNLLAIRSTINENSDIMDDLIVTSKLKSENEDLKNYNNSLENSIQKLNNQIENLTKKQISEIQDLKQYFNEMNSENKKIKKGLDLKNKEIEDIKEDNLKLLEKNKDFNKLILDLCSNNDINIIKENLIKNKEKFIAEKNNFPENHLFKDKLNTIYELENINLDKRI